MTEVSFWNPDANGQIRRDDRVVNGLPGLSRFSEVVLHQGRMEAFFIDAIRASPRPARVERAVTPTSMVIDEAAAGDEDAHPVVVTLRHLTEEEATPAQMLSNLQDGLFRSNLAAEDGAAEAMGSEKALAEAEEEVVRCKYVVGCDGAHSWTRKMLGEKFEMKGEMTDYIW